MTFFAIGIDPDSTATGIGLVARLPDHTTKPLYATVARAKGRNAVARAAGMADAVLDALSELREYVEWQDGDKTMLPHLCVVEWQAVRPGDPRPNDIANLCGMAGICLAGVRRHFNYAPAELILPGKWTGGIKKDIRHRRLQRRWDLDGLGDLPGSQKVIKTHQTHAFDGLDMAHWALNSLEIRRRHGLR